MEGAPRKFNQWLNPIVVSVRFGGSIGTATKPAVLGGTGNAPKVNYYLPGDTNFDTAVFKNIPIENKIVVQFRLETYNTFNHTEFNSLNNTATFATAATVGSTPSQLYSTFARMNGTLNP